MKIKRNAKQIIIECLRESTKPLAVHELPMTGYSQNNLATRLSELAREGVVKGQFRPHTSFKEWTLNPTQLVLF